MSRWIRDEIRLAIYLRDGLSCAYCGSSVEDGCELSLDHLKPRSRGGANDPSNLVTSCRKCNTARGDRPVGEFAHTVAGYLDHGLTGKGIVDHIKDCVARKLPKAEAKQMIKRRGSAFKSLSRRQYNGRESCTASHRESWQVATK